MPRFATSHLDRSGRSGSNPEEKLERARQTRLMVQEVQRRLNAVALKELRDFRDTVQEVQRRVEAVEARNRLGQAYDLPRKGRPNKLAMSQIQEIQRLRLRFSTRQTEKMLDLSHGVVVKYSKGIRTHPPAQTGFSVLSLPAFQHQLCHLHEILNSNTIRPL